MLLETDWSASEIPAGWVMKPIGQLCNILSGGTPSRADLRLWTGDVPWVSGKDMKAPRLRDATEHVSINAIGSGTRLAPAGAVFLLVRGMGLAKDLPVALALRSMAFNQDVKALVPREPGIGAFIRAALYQNRGQLLSRVVPSAHGTMTLNLDDVQSFEIAMPLDPAEARAIGDVMSLLHDEMDSTAEAFTVTRDLKRAAMRALFTKGLRGEARKETEIGPVPESWELKPVVEIADVKGGKRMPKGVSLVKECTGRPYIRVTDFADHGVREDGVLSVPHGYEQAIQRYRISCEDVYISIAGTIGLVGQIPAKFHDANLTENAAKLVFSKGSAIARYVMYALAANACQGQIHRATAKNAQPKLALTRIEQLRVPVPPTLDEQREIVAILDAIDRKIDLHRRKRAVLDELFKALLHKLMTGEIRVADLNLSALDKSAGELAA